MTPIATMMISLGSMLRRTFSDEPWRGAAPPLALDACSALFSYFNGKQDVANLIPEIFDLLLHGELALALQLLPRKAATE